MVMKIIRHSRKMFVYLTPLLLHFQHLSCGPIPKTDTQLKEMANGHNNTDLLIDEMQKALGAVDSDTGENTSTCRFNRLTKDEKIEQLIGIQEQRMTYDARFWPTSSGHTLKQTNKGLIRRDFFNTIRTAEAFHSKFIPDTTSIQDLPQNPDRLNAIDIIDTLQSALGRVRNKDTEFLKASITVIAENLKTRHHFFETLAGTCCISYQANQLATQHKIFLRTHAIPYLYFAQLQAYKQDLNPSIPRPINNENNVPNYNSINNGDNPPTFYQGFDPFKNENH